MSSPVAGTSRRGRPAPAAPDAPRFPAYPGDLPGPGTVGRGHAGCHHGELLQGVFRGTDGTVYRGLVTLPMARLGSRAVFVRIPERPAGQITVAPGDRTKARRAAELTAALCATARGCPPCGGHLELSGGIPVGLGMGSSTSDVIAAVRAVASGYALALPAPAVARLAVAAEGACDPLMLDHRPVLFAQRAGRVLEVLGARWPPLVVVGCVTGHGAPVDTLGLPEPGDRGLDGYEALRAELRTALRRGDVARLGRVSTESARRNQAVLPKDELDLLTEVAAGTGAAGVQVAHSGNVAGVLFDPDGPDLSRRVARCVRVLSGLGIRVTRVFRAGEPTPHRAGCGRLADRADMASAHRIGFAPYRD